MTILPLKTETLDAILFNCQKYAKEFVVQRLEYYDREIYLWVKDDPQKRFVLIRKDTRTLLTSLGIIRYKRNYYFDKYENSFIYLLDNQLMIPSHIRMSNELILKILDLASIMTYKEVGEHLSNEFTLSKFTIWNVIKNTLVEAMYTPFISRNGYKIHLQIDEKFIGMIESTNKKRYYTATVFAGRKEIGKNKYQLLNKTVLSAATLPKIKKLINYHLKEYYKVNIDEEIFVSGDLALYIQEFKESINVCKSKYVPDKYHVYSAIKKEIPEIEVDAISINDPSFQRYLIKNLPDNEDNVDSRKVRRLLIKCPEVFKTYLDKEYLGCSQEGQNSHIYAPRFGKYANRFSKANIEKLSLIREARSMNIDVTVTSINREIPEQIDLAHIDIDIENPLKYVLDTSEMKYETMKMFNKIKYGY